MEDLIELKDSSLDTWTKIEDVGTGKKAKVMAGEAAGTNEIAKGNKDEMGLAQSKDSSYACKLQGRYDLLFGPH